MKEANEIEKSCGDSWEKMIPSSDGRFVDAGKPVVQNITSLSTAQLQNFVRQNWGRKVNGTASEAEKVLVSVSDQTFFMRRNFSRAFVMAVFLVFGSSLVSATTINGHKAEFKISSLFSQYESYFEENTLLQVREISLDAF